MPQKQRVHYSRPIPQKQVKKLRKKKVNPIVYLFRLTVLLLMFACYACCVFPTNYRTLIKNVIFPAKVKINTEMPKGAAFNNIKDQTGADLYTMISPIANYLSNDLFLNRMLVTPTIQKTHSEVTTMYHTT